MARKHAYVTINGRERHVYERAKKERVNVFEKKIFWIDLESRLFINRPFRRIPVFGAFTGTPGRSILNYEIITE
jgi:hypothetical protein